MKLNVNDIHKKFGEKEVLKGATFEFEKGKMDSKISKESKINKFYFLKNHGSANDLFKTKKSYKDVTLNISNPTDSVAFDEISNNRCSLKNNIISKNANFSNKNLLQFNKKNS